MTDRIAEKKRATKETDIAVTVNLDGSGNAEIACPIGFLTHMLETLARYAAIDLAAVGHAQHFELPLVAARLDANLAAVAGAHRDEGLVFGHVTSVKPPEKETGPRIRAASRLTGPDGWAGA